MLIRSYLINRLVGAVMVVYAYDPSYKGGRSRRIEVLGSPGQKCEMLSKEQAKSKGTGYVAQVVECLPSKCETLSSIPNTSRKERKKKQKQKGTGRISKWRQSEEGHFSW
jgi:hypothetical protein